MEIIGKLSYYIYIIYIIYIYYIYKYVYIISLVALCMVSISRCPGTSRMRRRSFTPDFQRVGKRMPAPQGGWDCPEIGNSLVIWVGN